LHRALAVLPEGRCDQVGELTRVGFKGSAESALAVLVAESLLQTLLDPLHRLAVLLVDHLAVRPRQLLELAPHVVDLGRGLLAIQHAGADLDRPPHAAAGLLARGRALADHPGGALVGDREPLDHDPVVDQANGPVVAVGLERELWLLRGFHVDCRR
jgi:hypothetical protein